MVIGLLINVMVLGPPNKSFTLPRRTCLSSRSPCGQPASQTASQPAPAGTSQPFSQPASCHPVCQQLNPELLQASRINLHPSKIIGSHSFFWTWRVILEAWRSSGLRCWRTGWQLTGLLTVAGWWWLVLARKLAGHREPRS